MNSAVDFILSVALIILVASGAGIGGDRMLVSGDDSSNIMQQCANEFQKVTDCLSFASGKEDSPSTECCSSVSDIKGNNPVCLCFIIQQIHSGSNADLKSMGIQEGRLIQLPSACKLSNASISECPKLLHLPANSPDYAIFTNSSSGSTTTAPGAPPKTPNGSNGYKLRARNQLKGPAVVAIAVVFFFFNTEVQLDGFFL